MYKPKIDDIDKEIENPDNALKERHDKAFPDTYIIDSESSRFVIYPNKYVFPEGKITDEQKEVEIGRLDSLLSGAELPDEQKKEELARLDSLLTGPELTDGQKKEELARLDSLLIGAELTDDQKELARLEYATDHPEHLLSFDPAEYLPIYQNVVDRLEGHGIEVKDNPAYKLLLKGMARVMGNRRSLIRPIILTTRPGLGKTEMLIATLVEKSKMYRDYTAIVVIERLEDADHIAEKVNSQFDTSKAVCYVKPTFTHETLNSGKCRNGYSKDNYHQGMCGHACEIYDCPVKKSSYSFRTHRVVLITTAYFKYILDVGALDTILKLPSERVPVTDPANGPPEGYDVTLLRDDLFIDENPGMIFSASVSSKMITDCVVHLEKNQFDQKYIDALRRVNGVVTSQMGTGEKFEYTTLGDDQILLTKSFKEAWRRSPHPKHFNLPEIVNHFLLEGGIRQNPYGHAGYKIGVNRYREITEAGVRTVILDGTGIKDMTYRESDFIILNLPEIRDFSRATLHRYPKRISKSLLSKNSETIDEKIEAIANEAIKAIGNRKALFITYNDNEPQFVKQFEGEPPLDMEINHFGNLKGSNKYKDCDVVFFAGMNDWGPVNYFGQLSAISNQQLDLSTVGNTNRFASSEVTEFYNSLMALGIYQDLMRSNLRKTGSEKKVDIYLWTDNSELFDQVMSWLPGIPPVEPEDVPEAIIGSAQNIPLSAWEITELDNFKVAHPDYRLATRPKQRAVMLTKHLNQEPRQAAFEYVWGKILHNNFPKYKRHSKNYRNKLNLP